MNSTCTKLNIPVLDMVYECVAHLKKLITGAWRGRVASLKAAAATAVLFQIIPASIQMKSRLNPVQFWNEQIRLRTCFSAFALSNSFECQTRKCLVHSVASGLTYFLLEIKVILKIELVST